MSSPTASAAARWRRGRAASSCAGCIAALDRRASTRPRVRTRCSIADREVARSIAQRTAASGAATVALCAATSRCLSALAGRVGRRLPHLSRARGERRAGRAPDARRHLPSPRGGAAAGRLARRSRADGRQRRRRRAQRRQRRACRRRDAGALQRRRAQARRRPGTSHRLLVARTRVRSRAAATPAASSSRAVREAASDDATVLVVHRIGDRRQPRGTTVNAMTPEQIDRVFGRGRLKMVTGEHVEVFREAVAPASGAATPSASSIRPTATSRTGPSANGASSRGSSGTASAACPTSCSSTAARRGARSSCRPTTPA